MDNCIFCKIVKGEIPAARIWEDDNYLAFLNIHPHTTGHTLVIPKKHTDYLFDLEDKDLTGLILACKPIAKVLKELFNPKTGKVGLVVAGMGVPHVHVHLIPMDSEQDLDASSAKHNIPLEQIEETAKKVSDLLYSPLTS